jgi:hypothetical protein
MTPRDVMQIFALMDSQGLKKPESHGTAEGRAAAIGGYLAAFALDGYTWEEVYPAALRYAAEPQADNFPKPWPSAGHIIARTDRARLAARLALPAEGDAAWNHMCARMARLAYRPDRDVPARHLHPDPAKNDALFVALARFGGPERFRAIPDPEADPRGYDARKREFVGHVLAARREQGADPAQVRQMMAGERKRLGVN